MVLLSCAAVTMQCIYAVHAEWARHVPSTLDSPWMGCMAHVQTVA